MAQQSKSIFISFRRGDEAWAAGRLYDWLEGIYPDDIFMDVERGIAAGSDFPKVLDRMISNCEVVLAVIGKSWLTVTDDKNHRRLEKVDDFVRVEIASALQRNKLIIPVLVDNTQMPRIEDLPAPLRGLSVKNAVRMTQGRFKSDFDGLIREIAIATGRDHQAMLDRQLHATAHLLSPEQIRKNEEIANWNKIKGSTDRKMLRDHWARFPGGIYEHEAKARCEALGWEAVPEKPSVKALEAFLAEFPAGEFGREANLLLDARRRWEHFAWRWSLPIFVAILFGCVIGIAGLPQYFGSLSSKAEGPWIVLGFAVFFTSVVVGERQPNKSGGGTSKDKKKQK